MSFVARAPAYIGTVLALSCGGEGDPSAAFATKSQDLDVESTLGLTVNPESIGSPALVVRWQDAVNTARLDGRIAVVQNTTAKDMSAELVINMQAPDGQVAEQVLRTMQLAPHQAISVPLPARDLPLQSAGVASTLDLSVRYKTIDRHGLLSAESRPPPSERIVISRAPLMYVTHETAFEKASFRTGVEEARFNGESFRDGKRPVLQEIRGSLARAVSREATAAAPVQFTIGLPRDATGGPTPPPTAE